MELTSQRMRSLFTKQSILILCLKTKIFECAARVAQLVERLTCNEDVAGSTPVSGSIGKNYLSGGVPEWSKGTDCKSVGEAFGGSNPPPTTILNVSRL